MDQNDLSQVLLLIIAALMSVGTALGVVFGRQILARLDRLSKTDDEQWSVIRAHERELGELQAVRKMRSSPAGGD